MTVLTFPSISPASVEWALVSNSKSHTSPFSGQAQTAELAGARWRAVLSFARLRASEVRTMQAFLDRLRGEAGRFYLYHHLFRTPSGAATGTPLINGAGQTGTSIATKGWTINITGILKTGDYLAYDPPAGVRQLHQVVADANSDGTGLATIVVEPPIRISPADNATIIVTDASCVMKLEDDSQAGHTVRGSLSEFTIACIEPLTL